jgi:hypothetical protein
LIFPEQAMRHSITNLFKVLIPLVFLAGCTTTAPVGGASDIGYKDLGNAGPNRAYVCTTSKCGGLSIVVHRTSAISQADITEYEDLTSSPAGRALIQRELSGVSKRRGENGRVGAVSKTRIAGKSAAQFTITFYENGKRDGVGHVIMIVDKGKLQVFAAISESGSTARAEARQFAQKWAAGSK